MLKGKKGLYVLLPLVVFIWGMITYQVVDVFSVEESVADQFQPLKKANYKVIEREAFSIGSVDRDPFLGKIYAPAKTPKKKGKTRPKKEIKKKKWPRLSYKGMVSDNKGGATVFLLEINKQTQLVKIGQVVEDIKIISGNKKEVKITFQGEKKLFEIVK